MRLWRLTEAIFLSGLIRHVASSAKRTRPDPECTNIVTLNFNEKPMRHGLYIKKSRGVAIRAFPRSKNCKAGPVRVFDTANPTRACRKKKFGNKALGLSPSCHSEHVGGKNKTKGCIPVGNAITIQQKMPPTFGRDCVDDCKAGGRIDLDFGQEVLVHYIKFINIGNRVKIPVVPHSYNGDGSDAMSAFFADKAGSDGMSTLKLNTRAYRVSAYLFSGGAIAEVRYTEPCSKNWPKMCDTLLDEDPKRRLKRWVSGSKQKLERVRIGRDVVLRSSKRKSSLNGPELIFDDKNLLQKCSPAGANYAFSASVLLLDPKTKRGIDCSVQGPLRARRNSKQSGLCPTISLRVWDNKGRSRVWRGRKYRYDWMPDQWNKLKARFTFWERSDNWSGNISRFRIRISEMNPNLELYIDGASLNRIG